MAQVMAVSFEPHGRLHYLDAAGRTYAVGEHVLVPTDAGPEVARVVWAPVEVDGFAALPACQGPASAADLARDAANRCAGPVVGWQWATPRSTSAMPRTVSPTPMPTAAR